MKKKDEMRLRGRALDRRIAHHQKWSNWFGIPFMTCLVLLIFGVVFVFADRPNRLTWGAFALGAFLLGALSMALGVWHFARVDDLRALPGEQSGAKSVNLNVTGVALDLLRKDKALDDTAFTPPAAIGYGEGHDGGHE